MEDLLFFIHAFVKKEKQDRWSWFAARKIDKFIAKIDKLGWDLNDKCLRHELNIDQPFNRIVTKRNLKTGTYYDRWGLPEEQGLPVSPVAIEKMRDDSLIICRQQGVGLFINHESWLWVCKT
jgi:hypothetical protein